MHADWFFTIGKAHNVCEDYALSEGNLAFVSDGCSSSRHTDLGARLLVHAARTLLKKEYDWEYKEFGKAAISTAATFLKSLEMGYECLYATLIVAYLLPSGQIKVRMYGDGVIIGIGKDLVTTIEASFTNNMPYYLAYEIDSKSRKLYEQCSNEITLVQSVNGKIVDTKVIKHDSPVEYVFDPEVFSTILISSDGLSSFEDTRTRSLVDILTITKLVTDFKVMKGEFLKRRLNRVLVDLATNKIFSFDDIGVAAIHLKEGDGLCPTAISKEIE